MTIYNLGSINIDYIYGMPHLVCPGETLAATRFDSALGGKGANQSIAIARAGGKVFHAGMIHRDDDDWLMDMIAAGVDTHFITRGDTPTGHAIVAVDDAGENQIILAPLSNASLTEDIITSILTMAKPGDWALTQNETNLTAPYLKAAKAHGLLICYSAAPFVAEMTAELLPLVDLLIINAIEAEALSKAIGKPVEHLGVPHLIITRGSDGANYVGKDGTYHVAAKPVQAVDTTGAGDTYLGYMLAQLDQGVGIADAMSLAAAAAAIQVTRHGASAAIPNIHETKSSLTANLTKA